MQQQTSTSQSVVVYDEQPAQGVRYWIPSGWMPDGQGIAFADAFDQQWKKEMIRGVDIGSSWGMFAADRQPKAVVQALHRLR